MTISIVAVVPLLVLISYPGGEPYWDAYFRAVPLGITVLFIVMIFPGALLSLIGAAISPPDSRLDLWLHLGRFRKYLRSQATKHQAQGMEVRANSMQHYRNPRQR